MMATTGQRWVLSLLMDVLLRRWRSDEWVPTEGAGDGVQALGGGALCATDAQEVLEQLVLG